MEINPVIHTILYRYKYHAIKLEKKFGLRKKREKPPSLIDPFRRRSTVTDQILRSYIQSQQRMKLILNKTFIDKSPNNMIFDFGELFLVSLVSKLSTCFASPEAIIVRQFEEADCMYLISQGDCSVNIINEKREEKVAVKLLVEGNHFGEVGILYKIPRTATVISRNYNTMCRLDYNHFRDFVVDFPQYQKVLKSYVFSKYQDSRKHFIYRAMSQVNYLRKMPVDLFHEFYYRFSQRFLETD